MLLFTSIIITKKKARVSVRLYFEKCDPILLQLLQMLVVMRIVLVYISNNGDCVLKRQCPFMAHLCSQQHYKIKLINFLSICISRRIPARMGRQRGPSVSAKHYDPCIPVHNYI